MIGQQVGNYRITRLLGEGGMGSVYLAEHPGLGRRAAVKVLDPSLARNDKMIERFFNEARAANAIGHRGIVEVSDFGILPSGAPYIVMEYLPGENLAARLKRVGQLSIVEAVAIADQVAAALGTAHAKGVIHRDLKPDNVFLTPDSHAGLEAEPGEVVKILDFGIAKLAQRPAHFDDVRTRAGALMGTPQYMSPEQCRDASDVDHRTDIYSLGIVLYEMLTGSPPFSSSSWGELVHMHLGTNPPSPRTMMPQIPEPLEQIVMKTLEKDPASRFQSMAELQRALRRMPVRTLVMRTEDESGPGATMLLDPASARAPSTTFEEAAAEVEATLKPTLRPRWLSRPVAAAVAAGALACVIAVVLIVRGGDMQSHSPAPARSTETTAAIAAAPPRISAPPAPETPNQITVELVSDPEGARVIRDSDGATLGSTPLTMSWPRATGIERLTVQRDGYRSEQVVVPLERDLTARLHLEKAPATVPAPERGPQAVARTVHPTGGPPTMPPTVPPTVPPIVRATVPPTVRATAHPVVRPASPKTEPSQRPPNRDGKPASPATATGRREPLKI
jgi:tRNA A-37 threonylcarbamoyl transferase component Bud32